MRLFSAPPLLLLLSFGLAAPLSAEQLQMPAEGQSAPHSRTAMDMPVKGMSKAQVEQVFGKPRQILAPIGDPPISRWVYESYTVYFEYSHVIHSVAHR
ncbi:MAG: hypothetical protein OQL05_10290 [Gammaproteobacteria bacterium]|nr:hypothetical protein [Gammaproteobacteria bacterium]MCW8958519.1 hypothetical protein [Gammaproteobacteria bacterium]MCW8973650.1 hypothetical protein [Gammaproteobacteria bacterium]MCW8991678.1 hypothetical protein [Gammaproteobacteria bacterium]